MDRDEIGLMQSTSRARGLLLKRERIVSGRERAVARPAGIPVVPMAAAPPPAIAFEQGFSDGSDAHLSWARVGTSAMQTMQNRVSARRVTQQVMRE